MDFVHRFVNMSAVTVTNSTSEGGAEAETVVGHTCRPAMGYAFAAGTTDGPGMFNFHQATNETTPFWEAISDVLATPSPDQVACQSPKPILLDLSGISRPYQWDAEVVAVQLLRLGRRRARGVHHHGRPPPQGRRRAARRRERRGAWHQTTTTTTNNKNNNNNNNNNNNKDDDDDETTRCRSTLVLVFGGGFVGGYHRAIAGLANGYSDYVATYEEYQGQRYEAASTIYGPHTHAAYVQLFEELVDEMAASTTAAVASDGGKQKLVEKTKAGLGKKHVIGRHRQRRHSPQQAEDGEESERGEDGEEGDGGDDVMPPDLLSQQVQACPTAWRTATRRARGVLRRPGVRERGGGLLVVNVNVNVNGGGGGGGARRGDRDLLGRQPPGRPQTGRHLS